MWSMRLACLYTVLGCQLATTNAVSDLQTPFIEFAKSPANAGFPDATSSLVESPATRPFWAIAHRVLDKSAVDAALKHGANAIEIDMQPWNWGEGGWWACHDRWGGWGDKAESILEYIAKQRSEGSNIHFVWLDVKNPDLCDPAKSYNCSINSLQEVVRAQLLPSGVRVMYGLYSAAAGQSDIPSYKSLLEVGLDPAEAINIDGDFEDVKRSYSPRSDGDEGKKALTLPRKQRTMARGVWTMLLGFKNIPTELQKGVQSNYFGRVFGWTVLNSAGYEERVRRMIAAGVDGLIYGNALTNYDDSRSTRGAWKWIKEGIASNQDQVHLATRDDPPPW